MDLNTWHGASRPQRQAHHGRYAILEPLDPGHHGPELWAGASATGADQRYRYLFDDPPATLAEHMAWVNRAAATDDPLFLAVIDRATGRAEGRQALMRIDSAHGVIEIGNILWGPAIAGTRVATEALYLTARHVFADLGYRRLEWKCHNDNTPSKRAALRFGFTFEGVFRQHMVVKGANRDTAWFSMIDCDWPALAARFETWLDPENFADQGTQRRRLQDCG
jgi:RimJ/RimL family protein N-acetyltransferase